MVVLLLYILNFSVSAFEARGHVFVCYHEPSRPRIPGVDDARRIYCQICQGGVWVHLQSSQHCTDCGFSVHSACMTENNIRRECGKSFWGQISNLLCKLKLQNSHLLNSLFFNFICSLNIVYSYIKTL